MNRWLNINKVGPALSRAGTYIQLPTFDVAVEWLGYSDIVASFNVEAPNNFVFQLTELPTNPNYLLCIAWADEDGVVRRYKLWDHEDAVIYDSDLALYSGEIIKHNFRWEIWSVNNTGASETGLFQLVTSVKQNLDRIEADSALLEGNGTVITEFSTIYTPSTEPPNLTDTPYWWRADLGYTAVPAGPDTWASQINGEEFVRTGSSDPSRTTSPPYINDNYMIRFTSTAKKMELTGGNPMKEAFFLIGPPSSGATDGIFIQCGNVEILFSAVGAVTPTMTTVTVNSNGGPFTGSYDLAPGQFYLVHVSEFSYVYIYDLNPQGARGPVATFFGVVDLSVPINFGIGVAKEGIVVEILTYATSFTDPVQFDPIFKYFADRYGDGMFAVPFEFPSDSAVPRN